jgi:hypothetical protein
MWRLAEAVQREGCSVGVKDLALQASIAQRIWKLKVIMQQS